MVRPITIHEKPIFVPYVCIQCGLSGPPREWFVDLGFAVDHYFQTDNAAVYLCNECYFNLTDSVSKLLFTFRQEHARWSGDDAVAPSYAWTESGTSDIREPESNGSDTIPDGNTEEPTGATSSTDGNDQDTESDDSEPESSDSGDADSVDDSDTDESDRKIFTSFFGEGELPR